MNIKRFCINYTCDVKNKKSFQDRQIKDGRREITTRF